MRNTPTVMFYVLLSAIVLFEGLGVPQGREVAMSIVLVSPLFLAIGAILQKKDVIYFPKSVMKYFVLFIFLTFTAAFFSQNPTRSMYYPFFYTAVLFVVAFVFNYQEQLKKYFPFWIFSVALVFAVYGFLLKYLLTFAGINLFPQHGYQFVFSRFGSHNHLGDFLLLPIIASVFFAMTSGRGKKYYLLLIIFLPLYIFSFSRSAYLSLVISLLLFFICFRSKISNFTRKVAMLSALLVVISSLLLAATTWEGKGFSGLAPIHAALRSNFSLEYKSFTAKRERFALDAVMGIAEKPLFGIGPSNYIYLSGKYSGLPQHFTYTSHNLLLDIAAELGIFALIIFSVLLFRMFHKLDKESVYFFLAIAMFVNFQTDYTYRVYSFLLLFFVFLAVSFRTKEERMLQLSPIVVFALSLLLFFAGQYLLFHGKLLLQ